MGCFTSPAALEVCVDAGKITRAAASALAEQANAAASQQREKDRASRAAAGVIARAQGRNGPNKDDGFCEKQMKADEAVCSGLAWQNGVSKRCYASAALRYSFCTAGEDLPPVNCPKPKEKMNIDSIGTVIAIRKLECVTQAGDIAEILIKIGRPKKHKNAAYCPYQIVGIGNEQMSYAMGVDHLDAFLLALTKIGADIYSSSEAKEGRLTWMGDETGNLGIPVFAEVFEEVVPQPHMKLIV